ncbi:hypothetical protein GEMRC1_001448 [Eukaryota sp. GEM-RC1]
MTILSSLEIRPSTIINTVLSGGKHVPCSYGFSSQSPNTPLVLYRVSGPSIRLSSSFPTSDNPLSTQTSPKEDSFSELVSSSLTHFTQRLGFKSVLCRICSQSFETAPDVYAHICSTHTSVIIDFLRSFKDVPSFSHSQFESTLFSSCLNPFYNTKSPGSKYAAPSLPSFPSISVGKKDVKRRQRAISVCSLFKPSAFPSVLPGYFKLLTDAAPIFFSSEEMRSLSFISASSSSNPDSKNNNKSTSKKKKKKQKIKDEIRPGPLVDTSSFVEEAFVITKSVEVPPVELKKRRNYQRRSHSDKSKKRSKLKFFKSIHLI